MNQDIPLGLSYDDVLLIPQYSEIESRSDVDLSTQITPRIKLALPLISSNMSTVTSAEFAITLGKLGGLGVIPRFVSAEEEANMVAETKKQGVLVGAAVGVREEGVERAELLVKAGVDVLFLDVAHGYLEKVLSATKLLCQKYGKSVNIVAGNVATKEAAEALFKNGADSVKVGIGPGSTCITRIETGCGVPQITAVLESAKAAKRYGKTIICDGGMKTSGDIVKALAAGSSAIMTGHLFAGCKETPGKLIKKGEKLFKEYNGSTSLTEKNNQIKNLGKSLPMNYIFQIEGVETLVPYQGPLAKVIETMTANIRSGFSYCGAHNITELWKKAKFIRVTTLGSKENGALNAV
ncbi:MAG: guanosine monophosphate reductase [Candidatus Microgenomates bacterium]